jgi:hypothetical protein
MNIKIAPLIFIWIGNEIPSWALRSLNLAVKMSNIPVILLCNRNINIKINGLTLINIEDFYSLQHDVWLKNIKDLFKKYRDGFWIKTTERFLVLNAFVKKYNIPKFFHAELDNLIFDISKLSNVLDEVGSGFFCPRDQKDRGIGSLVYCNNINALEQMADTILSGKIRFENDMKLLGFLLENNKLFHTLPNESCFNSRKNNLWETISPNLTKGIFDAASIGQYILGIDPRNTGIVLRNGQVDILINAGCRLEHLRFNYNDYSNTFKINDLDSRKEFNLYNLHVHSKLFKKIENKKTFYKILNRLNENKYTLLSINFLRNKIFRSISYRFLNK